MKVFSPTPSLRPGTRQILLSFPGGDVIQSAGNKSTHHTFVYQAFLPLGLLLWGATDETFVKRIRIGSTSDGDLASWGEGAIPGRYFEARKSFAELQRLAELGELIGAVDAMQVLQMREAEPGCQITVDIDGPVTQFCMWGLTHDGESLPPKLARVVYQRKQGPIRPEEPELGSWLGEVIERRLSGDTPVFEVEAPTAEVAASLISTFLGDYTSTARRV